MVIADKHKTYEEVVKKALAIEEDNQEYKKELEVRNQGRVGQSRNPNWKSE